jgi:hypothetical protein
MKIGDMVRFINKDHTSYLRLQPKLGLVIEIDKSAVHRRPYNQRHLGSKVTVIFGSDRPDAYTEYSLEVVNENR